MLPYSLYTKRTKQATILVLLGTKKLNLDWAVASLADFISMPNLDASKAIAMSMSL